ncbi:hypothetical protein ACOSQ3_007042 [Xanthoceras sorbifolium]
MSSQHVEIGDGGDQVCDSRERIKWAKKQCNKGRGISGFEARVSKMEETRNLRFWAKIRIIEEEEETVWVKKM